MGLVLNLVYCILALVTWPTWSKRARGGWRERFGRVTPPQTGKRQRVLIHAVSVGEVNAVRPLIAELAKDCDVILSTTTDTGLDHARSLYPSPENAHHQHPPPVQVLRYPLDATFAVRRFLHAVQPHAVALAELELWPNFLRACRRRSIPVAVVNGRLSERSFRNYTRGRRFVAPYFRMLRFAAVQDANYAQRFQTLGTPCVTVSGSMKWDAAWASAEATRHDQTRADALAQALRIDRARPLVVAGSTTPDEHELIVQAVPNNVQLLIAPRRPESFDHAAEVMGDTAIRRSNNRAPSSANATRPTRFLLDTIGELETAYALADIAIIGRSFGQLFGSDPIQPAALGVPVIIGPAYNDFIQAVHALRDHAGLQIVQRETLAETIRTLLKNQPARRAMGQAARACVHAHRGATHTQATLIRQHLLHTRHTNG